MKLKTLIVCLLTLGLTGCLSPVKSEPPSSYVINSLSKETTASRRTSTVLLVLLPDARPIYQTNAMAYTVRPYQVQYFSENQWAETPAQMLLPLLTQTLQSTHRFQGVMSPPYTGNYQYTLSTQILRFEQDYLHQPHAFKLLVQSSLNRSSTNQLVASREFAISVPLPQESPYGGVLAANMAVKSLLKEIAEFVVESA